MVLHWQEAGDERMAPHPNTCRHKTGTGREVKATGNLESLWGAQGSREMGFYSPCTQSLSTSWLSYFPNQSSERSPSKQVPIIPLAPGVNFLQKEILS